MTVYTYDDPELGTVFTNTTLIGEDLEGPLGIHPVLNRTSKTFREIVQYAFKDLWFGSNHKKRDPNLDDLPFEDAIIWVATGELKRSKK